MDRCRIIKRRWSSQWTGTFGRFSEFSFHDMFCIYRFFKNMPADKPIQRGSWGLEIDKPLYLQESDPAWAARQEQISNLSLDAVHLRVDWQTLRRLPRSRAI